MQSQTIEHDNKTSARKKFKKQKKSFIPKGCYSIVFGNVAIILGLSLIILQTTITNFVSEKILNLNTDSTVFEMWRKYPIKVPYAMTFFNWTNHEDFFNRSVKPKFEEIGPYTFSQSVERVDIVRNDSNNTITFKQILSYQYDSNLPNNGNLSDPLITINYFTMLMGHLMKDWHNALKDVFSEYVENLDPYYYFVTTVDNEFLKGNRNLFMELANYLDFILPEFPRSDGFGWGKVRNGDPNFNGVYNIANGANRQFDVLNWNYYSTTPYYNEPCNKVKGSLGDVYSYPLNKEFITVFVAEVCRYLTLYFVEEVIVDGILGYKYALTKLSMDNGTLSPENKCFCVEPCAPSGLLYVSSCRFNINAFFSLPHFYNADPVYLDSFEGLNPRKEIHETYIVVEPNSLLCLEFNIAAQGNLLLYPVEGIRFFENFPELYFPLFWVKMHAKLPVELKSYLEIYLYVPNVIIITAILLMSLGIYVIYYGVLKFKNWRLKKSPDMDLTFIEKTLLNEY